MLKYAKRFLTYIMHEGFKDFSKKVDFVGEHGLIWFVYRYLLPQKRSQKG